MKLPPPGSISAKTGNKTVEVRLVSKYQATEDLVGTAGEPLRQYVAHGPVNIGLKRPPLIGYFDDGFQADGPNPGENIDPVHNPGDVEPVN